MDGNTPDPRLPQTQKDKKKCENGYQEKYRCKDR